MTKRDGSFGSRAAPSKPASHRRRLRRRRPAPTGGPRLPALARPLSPAPQMGPRALRERQASRMLEGLGYAILGRQIETSYAVDGQPAQVRLRADYLVSRAGRHSSLKSNPGPLRLTSTPPQPAGNCWSIAWHSKLTACCSSTVNKPGCTR